MYQKRELPTARDLVAEFLGEFPSSPLWPEANLLAGYVELADCRIADAPRWSDDVVGRLQPVPGELDRIRKDPDARAQGCSTARCPLARRARGRGPGAGGDDGIAAAARPADVTAQALGLLRLDPQYVRLHDAIAGMRRAAAEAPGLVRQWSGLARKVRGDAVGAISGTTTIEQDDAADANAVLGDLGNLAEEVDRARAELAAGKRGGTIDRADADEEDSRLIVLAEKVDAARARALALAEAADDAAAGDARGSLRPLLQADLAEARALERCRARAGAPRRGRRRPARPALDRRALPRHQARPRQGAAGQDRRGHRPEAGARHPGPGSRRRALPRRAARPAVGPRHDRRRRGGLAVRGRVLGRRVRGLAMSARTSLLIAVAALLLTPALAQAQKGDVDLERGPASELYIRKRPPAPESPALSAELQRLLGETEIKRDKKRTQAIAMLREFLADKPEGETRADGLFKLAELLWEEARRVYLENMDAFERKLEGCRVKRGGCKQPPVEPRLELAESEALYRTLLADHPDYRRADLVLYLVGFASKEDGREAEALGMFQQVIERFPASPLYGDAWMMIGEHWFAAEQWQEARDAYGNILTRPESATYDLALFKTAWCNWKLGDVDSAVRQFKAVLDLAVEAQRSGSAALKRRRSGIGEEALDYLVIVFTEDRSISAKEVFDFLASIGGEQYSRDVLLKVADAYFGQAEYERSADTYRFLISLEASALSAAGWQRKIVENWIAALDDERTRDEMKVLIDGYGPASPWAKRQRGQDEALTKSLAATETLVRVTATNMHAEAQEREKRSKKPDVKLYAATADAYGVYLSGFGAGDAVSAKAAEVRYRRAEILYFKLGKHEEAGDEYLAVGKTAPVGEYHKEALKKAMAAFEAARPKDTSGRKQLLPVDKKFAEAMDLYATLFPADPELVGLIFKNGQLFYDYGDYDEAIKRFGLIVTKYPDHPDAGPAGDRILKALAQGKDYENIEEWARRLKKAKAFAAADQQERLDRLIVESIGKSGEKYGEAGKYDQAAAFYLRVPKEFPKHKLAAQSMMNAGVMYEKAKKPEAAAEVYLDLAERYPDSDQGERSAFAAGQLYEKVAYFDRAAEAYEIAVTRAPKSKDAPDALYNAGVLRQALGQHDKAIAHFQLYAKRHKDRKDAAEVAFRIGAVYEDQGDDGRAEQAFRSFATSYKGHRRTIEAHVRAARTALRLGQQRRSADALDDALKLFKRLDKKSGKDREAALPWAAEARYLQGELVYREFEKISLDVKPKALDRTLRKKTDYLIKAQGIYADVVKLGDLRWGTAALYRIGQIFDVFAEALRSAPTPGGLPPDEAEAYRGALDMYVVEMEEKAIDLYAQGYAKAIELQVYDHYTTKIREALGRLSPDEYPPEREGRSRERIGERPLESKLVREVNR